MIISRTPNPKAAIPPVSSRRKDLIECLLANNITIAELQELRDGDPNDPQAQGITAEELSIIIQRIYDLNERYILELSTVDGLLRTLNNIKNKKRNARFDKKIKRGFRNIKDQSGQKKVILAEGDSWFNYPVLLTDIIDRIAMEKDFALHSLAAGGDWFLNMLSARQYVEELSILYPDVFLISGGGNDLVGSRRLAAILDPKGNSGSEYNNSVWAKQLVTNADTTHVPFVKARFDNGVQYLSKDFFALLMFFHLQYHSLIHGLTKKSSKFAGMKIITQGYDYPIPSYKKDFGLWPQRWYVPFIRMFLGHGIWLKTPMMMRGLKDPQAQRDVLYAMIYLFNEMMIDTGNQFKSHGVSTVFHIDSREFVGEKGWTDELHPKPAKQISIGEVFVKCINGEKPTYGNVYVVKKFF